MAMAKVFFSDLKTGRCSSVVEARLLRFWEARNVKRGGELMWMDLLMVDVNSTVMQVTISAAVSHSSGKSYMSGQCFPCPVLMSPDARRISDSLIQEAFRFLNHSELIGLANTNTQQPDIIGEILSVKSTVCDPPEEKNRVIVTLKLDSDETVTLSLFDSQAVAFHIQLEAMRVDPKSTVMQVTISAAVSHSSGKSYIGSIRFLNHSELIGLANTNTQQPEHGLRSSEEKNRVIVTLKLDSDETVTLSLFDSQAVAFHIQLEAMRVDPKVMFVTSIRRCEP
ncbi:hypothetical protein Bca52824_081586 [Brassica carinata]|uniref:Uncharacterized protein n=1 Tax=Brassica carinata TaxID=52824 RepID=A0A8X7PHH4_BRACI|nr:hypothetical protein Bca52824_081586 [Brassica carinata]